MRSKNAPAMTQAEREHVGRVKELPCSICDEPGPSEAHHIKQRVHFCAVAVCPSCHRGPMGWHGTKALWRIRKMDELDALAVTLERLAQ